jgi:hypothetical protein
VEKPVLSTSEESKGNQVERLEQGGNPLSCVGFVEQEFVPSGQTVN